MTYNSLNIAILHEFVVHVSLCEFVLKV